MTNVIENERKERIQALGFAALEINPSMTSGVVTRVELHHLVVHEVSFKRWLHFSDLGNVRASMRAQMLAERDLRIEAARIAGERRKG